MSSIRSCGRPGGRARGRGRERRAACALPASSRAEPRRDRVLERRDETGLFNSRHFVDALTREIERSRTYGRPLALALASIDGLAGRRRLREDVARARASIGGSVRSIDSPAASAPPSTA